MFKNAKEIVEMPEHTSWFLYGETGSGKTTAAASFPRPVFLVPAQEKSHVSLGGKDVDYTLIASMADMEAALRELERRAQAAMRFWADPDPAVRDKGEELFPWGTIVVESITHYSDILQEELSARSKYGTMDQQLWGVLGNHMRNLQMRLRAMPVHTIFTSLVRYHYNEKQELVSAEAAFPGQTNYKLPATCDVISYMEEKGGKYLAHFRRQGVYISRSRFLPLATQKVIEDLTWDKARAFCGW